jgi:hypothetical protein
MTWDLVPEPGDYAPELIVIDPAAVTASSEIPGYDRQDDYIVDGSGLTAGEHGTTASGTMWESTGDGVGGIDPDPSVTFDLGAVYTINSFHVWNYNEGVTFTPRGVNDVSVEYGITAALGSTVAGITNFAQATGAVDYTGEEFSTFTPFSARYIKFDINSNHGDVVKSFYGLSEVQFYSYADPLVDTDTSISMTATAAADINGVEYFFDCNSASGHDSGWQDGNSYSDTGLMSNTTYTYKVMARDKSPAQNATAFSPAASATTDSPAPCDYTCGDQDGVGVNVDLVDFGLFADCWGEDPSLNASCICANLVEDGDHIIDLSDLAAFAELFLDSSLDYPPNDCLAP